jgi:CubicO group peptidase (beta-lactamase class C family)
MYSKKSHHSIWVLSLMVLATGLPISSCKPETRYPQELTSENVEALADEFFTRAMREHHTPGVSLVVVSDGVIQIAKGYGFANRETETPIDPYETVMRIGSISKLFVATAVMQLVEQGTLDLHEDINHYLRGSQFIVDNSYSKPVTLAHLLTHTSGFGETWQSSTNAEDYPSLGEYLAGNMPDRFAPPGAEWRYSGHGMALAAYVVEVVSGEPFDQYVRLHILRPLQMDHSRYVLDSSRPLGLAQGYVYKNWGYEPQPMDYYGDYPSASLVATAGDIAQFMLAYLNGGCVDEGCILKSETIELMQFEQIRTEEGDHALGFVQGFRNGERLIGHSGAIRGFGAIMDLIPEQDVGYFFAFNLECLDSSACEMIPEFRSAFMDLFFIGEVP